MALWLTDTPDFFFPYLPKFVQFNKFYYKEQHCSDVPNTLPSRADLKQVCLVPLAFHEEWGISMLFANAFDEKN